MDGNKAIRFISDNGFGKSINMMGKDISAIFSDLSSGLLPVQDIENILVCGIHDIDDIEVKEADRVIIAQQIIDDYGLQECHQLAWVLLSHIMIGKKKCSAIDVRQRREMMIQNLIPGLSTNSKKAGLLWVAIWISSTIAACMTSSFLNLLIV